MQQYNYFKTRSWKARIFYEKFVEINLLENNSSWKMFREKTKSQKTQKIKTFSLILTMMLIKKNKNPKN